jgi:hypothetical protein
LWLYHFPYQQSYASLVKPFLPKLLLFVFFFVGLFIFAFPYRPELEYFFVPARVKQFIFPPTRGYAAFQISAYQVPVSQEEQQNGIEERWCLSYTGVPAHTGRMATYFRWAYQNGIRKFRVVDKQNGKYSALPVAADNSYCSRMR